MEVGAAVAAVLLAVSVGSCRDDVPPGSGGTETVAAATEAGVDREDCRSIASASVRGVTGTFASAPAAARSVRELPDDGVLVLLEAGAARAQFGWVVRGAITHVIDTHQDPSGWTVGSYERCAAPSDAAP